MNTSEGSPKPNAPTLQRAFETLVTTFLDQSIQYAIVGGIATIQYGRVRVTDDVDARACLMLRRGSREPGEQEGGELGALGDRGEVDELVGRVETGAGGAEGVEGGDAGGGDAVSV